MKFTIDRKNILLLLLNCIIFFAFFRYAFSTIFTDYKEYKNKHNELNKLNSSSNYLSSLEEEVDSLQSILKNYKPEDQKNVSEGNLLFSIQSITDKIKYIVFNSVIPLETIEGTEFLYTNYKINCTGQYESIIKLINEIETHYLPFAINKIELKSEKNSNGTKIHATIYLVHTKLKNITNE